MKKQHKESYGGPGGIRTRDHSSNLGNSHVLQVKSLSLYLTEPPARDFGSAGFSVIEVSEYIGEKSENLNVRELTEADQWECNLRYL